LKLIVADAGPLIVLARSGLLPIAKAIVDEIAVPEKVFEECTADTSKPGAKAIRDAETHGIITFCKDVPIPAILSLASTTIDPGEMAAIALALQLGCAVLIDDRLGRQVARNHHLVIMGSAAILLRAKEAGLLPEVSAKLLEWKGFGYFLSDKLVEEVLKRANETRPTGL
jgi:uncharacterized protein